MQSILLDVELGVIVAVNPVVTNVVVVVLTGVEVCA
jgi:hypothetical protein